MVNKMIITLKRADNSIIEPVIEQDLDPDRDMTEQFVEANQKYSELSASSDSEIDTYQILGA